VPEFGAHFYIAEETVPEDAVFMPPLGGLVYLASEGNADLSSEKGALAVYRTPEGVFYAEEVFDGAERIVFVGRPISP